MSTPEIVKLWNDSGNDPNIKSTVESLNCLVEHNINIKKNKIKITLIPLYEENIWNKFLCKLEKNKFNNTAILFYTSEEIPRGAFPDSVYNQSRMIRSFFENTTYARTANYRNIVDKLKELIVEIKKNKKKSLIETIKDLDTLTGKIPNISSSKQTLKELSNIYTYQSFHSRKSHGNLREFKKFLEANNLNDAKKLNDFKDHYYLARKKHDIASIISVNPIRYKPLKILVIDDNPDIEHDLLKIIQFLPENTEVWLTEGKEYKKFIYQTDFIKKLYTCEAELRLKKIKKINNGGQNEFKLETLFSNNGNKKFNFDYVIVDLLLGDYNEGNKIIRQLVKLRDYLKYEQASFFILTYSQSEDVDDIYRSFAEGSLGYAWKFNRVYHIPFLIGELETARQKFSQGIGVSVSHSTARNFEKLYHLPPKAIMRLRTESFLPILLNSRTNKFEQVAKDVAKNWISKIPKADLHYHLGGAMDDNIIFYLAVNSFYYFIRLNECKNVVESIQTEFDSVLNGIDTNQDFYDQFFKKKNSYYKILKKIKSELTKSNNNNAKKSSSNKKGLSDNINSWLKQTFGRKDKIKDYIDKNIDKPAEMYFDFLAYKYKMSKDDIITIFIVYIGLREGRTIEDARSFWDDIKNNLDKLKKDINNNSNEYINRLRFRMEKFKPKILENNGCSNLLNIKIGKYYNDLLKTLLRAPENANSLAEMFRGDCFFGALHLQYYENIVACIWYLTEQAVKEKNRYLEIRVSPSGYTKKDLGLKDAVEALIDGANFSSLHHFINGEFVWVNFIATLKRHKTSKERVEELVASLINGKKKIEKLEEEIKEKLLVSNFQVTRIPYEWKASRFVSVDLAGYESKFPPNEFIEDFSPAFKLSTFITIHAGEEAGPQFIWEAIYKLQANRIGHGLTIYQAPSLMNFVRDTQTCIEMCPLSNEITNFRERNEKYPLYKYLKEGLNVTINTDDKATTGGNINDDFVKAAEYFYLSEDNEQNIPLTKWETLRLIKAGFDNAFIHREEKRKLLRWVEEEIYEIILREYEIEPFYIIDK